MVIEPQTRNYGIAGTAPRVYRLSTGRRAALLILSLLFGGLAVAGIWYFGAGGRLRAGSPAIVLIADGSVFLLLSAYLAAWMYRVRVTLWPDRIQYQHVFARRTLARHQILGYRRVRPSRGPEYIVLVPKSSSLRKMKIAKMYNFDGAFYSWINSLPDLDARDFRAAEQEIAANQQIGATPADRMEALTRGKRQAAVLTAIAVGLGLWAVFYPNPYRFLMASLALLPWIAIALTLRSGGLFRLDARKNDPHPSLAAIFLMPGCVLALRVMTDMNLLDWRAPLYVSAALTCMLGAAAVLSDSSLKEAGRAALIVLLLSAAYGFGASMQINALLDHSPTTVYRAEITDMRVSHGRHTSYNLYLAPWGPKLEPDHVTVSRRFYNSVSAGDSVCLALRSGALNIPWYTVHQCLKPVQGRIE
jgi:hypothetical protein